MILHQQILHPESGPHLPWVALHVESLTLAYCEPVQQNEIKITPLKPQGSQPSSCTTAQQGNPVAFAMMIEQDIRQHLSGVRCTVSPKAVEPSAIPEFPDYLLVNSLDGITPGVLHTGDPFALYLSEKTTAILQPTEHFSSQVDLSVEGWAYWWEDAQRAFIRLTIEFAQACGSAVPEHISAAARHL